MQAYEGYFEKNDFFPTGKTSSIPITFFERKKVKITVLDEKPEIKEHKTLQKRLEEFYGKNIETIIKEHSNDYQPSEIDWGKAVGEEVW